MIFWSVRFLGHTELDDVHPEIQCDEDLYEKSDVIWVVPLYESKSIAENEEWCSYILDMNKTIGLHGVRHNHMEFDRDVDESYLYFGISAFEECFGFKPEIFKAPYLAISETNENLVEDFGMKIKGRLNQITHKVYHCSDHGIYSNKLIKWI